MHQFKAIKSIGRLGILCTLATIALSNGQPAVAQSTDRTNPTPLTSRQINGNGGSNRVYFYSFVAGEGELSVAMRNQCGSATGFGAASTIEDSSGNPLLDISPGAAYPGQPQSVTRRTNFSGTTPVIVRVSFYGGDPSCTYQIDFNGAAIAGRNTTATTAASNDLTGRWQGNDGGTYYIRQIGDRVWWFGESDGASWSNVLQGSRSGNRLVGDWADVPKGSVRQSGTLTLQINTLDRLTVINQTGGFGGTEWRRR